MVFTAIEFPFANVFLYYLDVIVLCTFTANQRTVPLKMPCKCFLSIGLLCMCGHCINWIRFEHLSNISKYTHSSYAFSGKMRFHNCIRFNIIKVCIIISFNLGIMMFTSLKIYQIYQFALSMCGYWMNRIELNGTIKPPIIHKSISAPQMLELNFF